MTFATSIHRRGSQRLLALVSTAALMVSIMAVFAPPAWAHQGTVSWDCDGWSIGLTAYVQGADITVTVDGQTVDTDTGWNSYSNSGSWDDSQSHTLQVVVDAYDDGDQPVHNLGSNDSFSPAWQQGEWSFTLNATQDACTQPPQDVSTTVEAGSCSVGSDSQPAGSIEATINPSSGATVNVYSDAGMTNLVDSLTSSGSVSGLSPGTYYWEAIPADGYELSGPSSGSVVIGNCDVTVSVSGLCEAPNGVAVGEISVQISVDDAATVEISDSTNTVLASLTETGAVNVPVNASYTWEATASSGFDLSGSASGTVDIEDCTPPVVGAAVTVSVGGECVVEGIAGQGVISVTVSVAGGATVVVTDSDGVIVGTLQQDGSITVPEDAVYSWSATANAGFEFPPGFDASGTITIEECTPIVVGASIVVTVAGTCVLDGDDGSGVISVNVSVDGGATVVVSDSDGEIVGTFSQDGSVTVPEGAVYSWLATPNDGFEFPAGSVSSGSVTIETCSNPDVLPFTGVYADQLATFGFILLAAGVVVMTSGWYLGGWREES